jgi:hypothetical protein
VYESTWVSVASLNLENTASQWWKTYKLRYEIGGWQEFTQAVTAKFGVAAYAKALRRLMSLKHKQRV